jgi:tetratricopeptide (TPR) repeat protein
MPTADAMLSSAKRAYAARDMKAAAGLCESLVKLAPTLAEPWILLGTIELRRGRPASAITMADMAIALEPRNSFGRLLRCRALFACARSADAVEAALDAIAIGNCPPVVLDGFGMILFQLSKYPAALDLFTRAVEASPGNTEFVYNLACAERICGALDDAERHFDQVIAREPGRHTAFVMRSDLRRQTLAHNHVEQMERMIADGVRGPEAEIALRFALAKECEDIGDPMRAMNHLQTGAGLQRRRLGHDVRTDIALIDRIIGGCGRGTLDSLSGDSVAGGMDDGGPTHDDPIFIVGLPRSGTTLVERIVASHGSVVAAGELMILPRELDSAARRAGATRENEWVERLPAIDWAALGRNYARRARALGLAPDKRFIDKYPLNFLLCGAIRMAFPRAKIIALRRHPMASCFALYKTLFNGTAYPFSYDLGDLAEYYAAFSRLMRHWRASLPPHLLLEVAYEDVVADLEGQSRRILAFLGLEWDDKVMRFHESEAPSATASATQVRRPIYSSSIDSWRRHAQQLAPLRARLSELIPPAELGL